MAAWKDLFGFGKEKGIVIGSPIEGEACSLDQVEDATFRERILGEGIAIIPKEGKVVAPVDGTVAVMFETGHAVSLISEQGTEILIHIGLDTVKLKGKYFTPKIKVNDKVKAGDLLLEFDMDKIKEAGYDLITPIVICNTSVYSEVIPYTGAVKELDKILVIKK